MSEAQSSIDFTRGYICACTCILSSHGRSTEVDDALKCIGFDKLPLRLIDDADKRTLKEWGYLPRKKKGRL